MVIFSISNKEQEQTNVDDIIALDETDKGILSLENQLIEQHRQLNKINQGKKKCIWWTIITSQISFSSYLSMNRFTLTI